MQGEGIGCSSFPYIWTKSCWNIGVKRFWRIHSLCRGDLCNWHMWCNRCKWSFGLFRLQLAHHPIAHADHHIQRKKTIPTQTHTVQKHKVQQQNTKFKQDTKFNTKIQSSKNKHTKFKNTKLKKKQSAQKTKFENIQSSKQYKAQQKQSSKSTTLKQAK